MEIPLRFLTLKSSVIHIISEPLSIHLKMGLILSTPQLRSLRGRMLLRASMDSPKSRCSGAIITIGSISFPEKRTHGETVFRKDDSQDDFHTFMKVKKLLFCCNSLRNHVISLVGTIATSSLGVGSFSSPYGYVDYLNTMPPERKAGGRCVWAQAKAARCAWDMQNSDRRLKSCLC